MNESRNQNADIELPLVIDFQTPQSKYEVSWIETVCSTD